MTNTAKHFCCYTFLLLVCLFLFGAFHKADLARTQSQQELADKTYAIGKILSNSQNAIVARDAQIKLANEQLRKSQETGRTLDRQTELVEQLLTLRAQPVKFPDCSRLNPSTEGNSVDKTVPSDSWVVPATTAISAPAIEYPVLVEGPAMGPVSFAYACPITKKAKFLKGLKWVFSLGSSK